MTLNKRWRKPKSQLKRLYRCALCKKKKNRCSGVLCTQCYIKITGKFPQEA